MAQPQPVILRGSNIDECENYLRRTLTEGEFDSLVSVDILPTTDPTYVAWLRNCSHASCVMLTSTDDGILASLARDHSEIASMHPGDFFQKITTVFRCQVDYIAKMVGELATKKITDYGTVKEFIRHAQLVKTSVRGGSDCHCLVLTKLLLNAIRKQYSDVAKKYDEIALKASDWDMMIEDLQEVRRGIVSDIATSTRSISNADGHIPAFYAGNITHTESSPQLPSPRLQPLTPHPTTSNIASKKLRR
ncbi:hypothetical protein CMUS01_12853 [Colletotrichum musicola]|uniref:Uncharacterized protein n=1 Tax=Colletotrichum musicola TaxID=2175873 RepID=A0A8H6JHV3_9PEZI|nr:hypothetical protein CMUS01_12853 [Colletotrichum musicola]